MQINRWIERFLLYFSTSERRSWGIFFLALGLCLVMIPLVFPLPSDVGQRYVPMAEAFSQGYFRYAFHPRFPPLLPVIAGSLTFLTGLPAAYAVQLTGSLFFALSAVVLYRLFLLIFDGRTAITGALLYVVASRMMRIAVSGFRESGKALGFILACYGFLLVYRNATKWRGYLWCALGCFVMSGVRGDSVVFAFVFLAAALVVEIARRKVPWKSIAAGILYLTLLMPFLGINAYLTGYYVPEARFIKMAEPFVKMTGWSFLYRPNNVLAKEKELPPPNPAPPAAMQPTEHLRPIWMQIAVAPEHRIPFDEYTDPTDHEAVLRAVLKGLCWYLAIPAMIAVFWRIRKKVWTKEETILLSCYLGHALLMFLMILVHDKRIFMDRRYLEPVAPLAYAWTAMVLLFALDELRARYGWYEPSLAWRFGLVVLAVFCFMLDAVAPALRSVTSMRRNASVRAVRMGAEWIRADYAAKLRGVRFKPVRLTLEDYRSCYFPSVRGADELYASECGAVAGGQSAWQNDRSDYVLVSAPLMGVYDGYANYVQVHQFDSRPGYGYRIFRRKDLL